MLRMSTRENIYLAFYTICFILAILAGGVIGYVSSHTPPGAFMVEFFALPIGFVLLLIDAIKHRTIKVHVIGLIANGAIMTCVLIPALFKLR